MGKKEKNWAQILHFLCCHCLELSRKLVAHYITCAHYCWMSSMIGKIGLAGARWGERHSLGDSIVLWLVDQGSTPLVD